MSNPKTEQFVEIAHCGGKVTITGTTHEEGRRIETGLTHSAPTPAAFYVIWVHPVHGAVAVSPMMGFGQQQPIPEGCFQVIISSDSHGMFGHQCRRCNGYWRSRSAPPTWPITCAYCGLRAPTHRFLTRGQLAYAEHFCNLVLEVINAPENTSREIDMDVLARSSEATTEKPPFYYVEESQQNRFTCPVCRDTTDILGRYGYCSCCGTHNGAEELKRDLKTIHERITAGGPFEACTKDAVAAFDSLAGHYAKQLVKLVPMTPYRRERWRSMLFHNLARVVDNLKIAFDIDLTKGMGEDDLAFAVRMFHRRHVYEHKGGEVDQKYIDDSGDTSVRVKQQIYEDEVSARHLANIVQCLGDNLHSGFMSIFPPNASAIRK